MAGRQLHRRRQWRGLGAEGAGGDDKNGALAFISENTKDFAAPDEKMLREELIEDLRRFDSDIVYYASLDDFLREHAEPVGYITGEWVRSMVNWQDVREVVRGYVLSGGEYGGMIAVGLFLFGLIFLAVGVGSAVYGA